MTTSIASVEGAPSTEPSSLLCWSRAISRFLSPLGFSPPANHPDSRSRTHLREPRAEDRQVHEEVGGEADEAVDEDDLEYAYLAVVDSEGHDDVLWDLDARESEEREGGAEGGRGRGRGRGAEGRERERGRGREGAEAKRREREGRKREGKR